ncbi:hypothetical protein ACIQUQ_11365 [Streptomyces sp. NPDC101118]|uniref:hypothetical protein n=1 Tax=Streptomyces sp. NPDC101118 TaxID=3366109 RepID=UPI003805DD12
MSIRSTTKARRGAAAIAVAAALVLAVSGCGGDGGSEPESKSPSKSADAQNSKPTIDPSSEGASEPRMKLAEVKGTGGVVFTINEAKRDAGGFLTVSGSITNEGDSPVNTSPWAGIEVDVVSKNPNSVAGATLVDKLGKKRYYTLRDTDGRCLCTTGLGLAMPKKTLNVFMQFPAPPEGTAEVDFSLPTFATATIKISG